MKSMKRILTDNVGHGMKLNGKKAAVALMEYKQIGRIDHFWENCEPILALQ